MTSKKKTLLSAVLAIVFCMSLIAGSTFALFTSESKVNIAVNSGKVEVVASVGGMNTYSVEYDDAISEEADDYAGTVAENKLGAGKYKYVAQPAGQFSEGGTAEYADGTLTLNKMIPGDKVTFNVNIANNSNVNIKYRVIVQVNSGLKLFTALKVKIDGTSFTGVKRTGNWTSLAATAGVDAIADIPVEIYMPVDTGNEYQDLSTSMYISIEAVQGNAKTVDGALTSEVQAVAENPTTVGENNLTTGDDTVISDSDNLVTVTIPASTKLSADVNTSSTTLAVTVTPQDTVSNLTLLSTQASASYDVSVLLTTVENDVTSVTDIDAIDSDNTSAIKVQMFVGANLKGVELYHKTDRMNAVDTLAEVDVLDEFYYDSESGVITFMTKSFSEYTVLYNKDYAVETDNGIVVYEATENAGVYTTKDENNEKINVVINEDEQGNVSVDVINYITETTKIDKSGIYKVANNFTGKITVDGDIDVNLDLSGYIVTYAGSANDDQTLNIINGARVTLKDSSGDNDGAIKATGQYGRAVYVENGTLTVDSGSIAGPQGIVVGANGTLVVNGGAIYGTAMSGGNTIAAIYNEGYATINGGEISGYKYGIKNTLNMTITGGTIEATGESQSYAIHNTNTDWPQPDAFVLTISGGIFKGVNSWGGVIKGSKITITEDSTATFENSSQSSGATGLYVNYGSYS